MNPTIDLLKSHRSIRQFTDQPIADDLFEQLIFAGQAAASSSFLQGVTVIRISDTAKRDKLAELAGNQAYVRSAAEFLVFCADLNRSAQCCHWHGKVANTGFTEQFIIATVDAALMAQNVCVAAESAGLGICYIGALRNHPDEVAKLLNLPENAYAVFGLCVGWPAQSPEVKPRLPLEILVHENSYKLELEPEVLEDYDAIIKRYYESRTDNPKSITWSEQMSGLLSREARPHMLKFLRDRGLALK